jgi:hypothetical protein
MGDTRYANTISFGTSGGTSLLGRSGLILDLIVKRECGKEIDFPDSVTSVSASNTQSPDLAHSNLPSFWASGKGFGRSTVP